MNRIVLCLVIAGAYLLVRLAPPVTPKPEPAPTPVVTPVDGLGQLAAQMSKQDRQALSQAYDVLSRSVAANPVDDPVFATTGSVREAHRAALLCVWRGVLGNQPGKYEGLREALEGALAKRIGSEDIPLNPALQAEAAAAFADIAATLR